MSIIKIPFLPEDALFQNASFPQYKKITGTNFPPTVLAFDASIKETGFWKFKANSYGSGDLTCVIRWAADTATSGAVVWGVQIACITPDTDSQDITTKAFATAHTGTDSHLGTTPEREMTLSITLTNLDSLAAGDTVWLAIYRDAAAGGDTMAGDAFLIEASIEYSDT
jgi:hypothetical protein